MNSCSSNLHGTLDEPHLQLKGDLVYLSDTHTHIHTHTHTQYKQLHTVKKHTEPKPHVGLSSLAQIKVEISHNVTFYKLINSYNFIIILTSFILAVSVLRT